MQANQAPPLDLDLATVDTGFQLLANGIYDVVIEKAEVKMTNDQSAKMISLDMKTTSPASSQKGEALGPGIHVFDNIMLSPKGGATWEMVTRNVAALVQAVGLPTGTAKLTNGQINAEAWVPQLNGRPIRIKVGYQPAGSKNGKSFREKNVVETYVKR